MFVSEVKDECEELRPDTAGLHRLRGLSEHMLHDGLKNPSDQRYLEKFLRNALMELHFLWHKSPLRLEDELWDDFICKRSKVNFGV